MIDTLFDDPMIEMHKMIAKDIAKIEPPNWGSILKSLCIRGREKDVKNLIDIIQKYRIKLDNPVYTFLLKTCTHKGWIELGKCIHNYIEQNRKLDLILKNCLINMYRKCGHLEEAIKIFNNIKISERDVIIRNTMILAYGEHGKGREAPILYEEMQKGRVKPNNQTVTCILKACCESNLIDNAAEMLFSMEKRLGIKPDGYHYNCLLTACAGNRLLLLGIQIHNHIIENNYPQSIILKTTLINMYGKCGNLEEALKIFNDIQASERNIITWNSMISAYGEHGKGREAPMLYEGMQKEGMKPNGQTISCISKACCESGLIDNAAQIFFSIENKLGIKPDEYQYNYMLTACADNGLLSLGKKIHKHIIENKQIESIVLKTSIINMYGKCGCLEEAIEIFNSIKACDRNIITWSTMILAFGQHGKGKEAPELFEQMQQEGLLPNEQLLLAFRMHVVTLVVYKKHLIYFIVWKTNSRLSQVYFIVHVLWIFLAE
jgi:pentatricopeptide repeat protein